MQAQSSTRKKILASKGKPGKVIEVEIGGEKLKLEIKPPNMSRKVELAERAGIQSDGTVKNPSLFPLEALIECVFDPETGQRMFNRGDRDALADLGSEIDPVLVAVQEMFKPPEDAAKNSESGPSAG